MIHLLIGFSQKVDLFGLIMLNWFWMHCLFIEGLLSVLFLKAMV